MTEIYPLENAKSQYFFIAQPVRHFSGYDPKNEGREIKGQNRFDQLSLRK